MRKATTKTGAFAAHDLKLCPLVLGLLDRVPADRRAGPLIVGEIAGRPFAGSAYGREWRAVALAAGLPDHVWSVDARAGAITEAECRRRPDQVGRHACAGLDHAALLARGGRQIAEGRRARAGALGREERGLNSPWGTRGQR